RVVSADDARRRRVLVVVVRRSPGARSRDEARSARVRQPDRAGRPLRRHEGNVHERRWPARHEIARAHARREALIGADKSPIWAGLTRSRRAGDPGTMVCPSTRAYAVLLVGLGSCTQIGGPYDGDDMSPNTEAYEASGGSEGSTAV